MIYNNEIITYNECTNAGDRIYTYFDDVVGAMESFGYSAYLAAKMVKDVLCLWDDKIGMPCAILRKEQMDELLKMGEVDAQTSNMELIQLNLNQPIPLKKSTYDQWLQVLKARKVKVASPLPINEVMECSDMGNAMEGKDNSPFMGSHIKNETTIAVIAMLIALFVAGLIYFFSR